MSDVLLNQVTQRASFTWRFYLFIQHKPPWRRSLPPWDKGAESLPFSPPQVTTKAQAKQRFVPGWGAGAQSRLPLLGSQRQPVGCELGTSVLLVRVLCPPAKSWGGKIDVWLWSPCWVGGCNASFIRLPKRGCWAALQVVMGLGLPKTQAPHPWCGHTVPQTKLLPGCIFCPCRQGPF